MRSKEGVRAGVWTKEGDYEVDERERLAELAHVGAPTISLVEAGLSAIRPRIDSHFNRALAECQMPQFLIYREGSYIRPHRNKVSEDSRAEYAKAREISVMRISS